MNAAEHREVLEENLLHSADLRPGAALHLSAQQWPEADDTGVAAGQVSDCPWAAKLKPSLMELELYLLPKGLLLSIEVRFCLHMVSFSPKNELGAISQVFFAYMWTLQTNSDPSEMKQT